jgi:carboxypeptidase family protein
MRPRAVSLCSVIVVLLALPATGYAQEAALSGTVTDSTGAVLPGVTVTAVLEATGNTYVAVTDERGAYRLSVRIGVYRISGELTGFRTVSRTRVELLVGRQVIVNLEMSVSAVEESVTVTGAAPLLDVTQSTLSGNVDSRQMQELPLNARNWMDLTMLAAGSRTNALVDHVTPQGSILEVAAQLNVDGQQVTNLITGVVPGAGWGQPRFSRDAIAEFEFVSNRFDATQGRSSGVQVNAVTKSGTNSYAGTTSGYFRDDKLNAKDFIVGRVLPYSNQQVSATLGGPLKRDRAHFFGYYDHEREPNSFTFTSQYPRFNIPDLRSVKTVKLGGTRGDLQLGNNRHLMGRVNLTRTLIPYQTAGGASAHPSASRSRRESSTNVFTTFSHTIGARAVHEVRGGLTDHTGHSTGDVPVLPGGPRPMPSGCPVYGYTSVLLGVNDLCFSGVVTLRGYTIGQDNGQIYHNNRYWSLSDRWSTVRSTHAFRFGGEYINYKNPQEVTAQGFGNIDATGGAVPANIEDLFPVWNDPYTWNFAALSPITVQYTQRVGAFNFEDPRHYGAAWFQDDWTVTSRLTLNLGLRYDVCQGCLAEYTEFLPFKSPTPVKKLNLAPRLGFAYLLPDQKTVIRGGAGKYFADVSDQLTHHTKKEIYGSVVQIRNDGRPDFAANPWNGPPPTRDQILAAGTWVRATDDSGIASPDLKYPYSYQTSIGFQRQLDDNASFEADYVWTGSRNTLYIQPNINLSYNPATGANYPFTDVSRRPYPEWGAVSVRFSDGYVNYHALQTAFTKRLSQNWQASATYTLSATKEYFPPPRTGFDQVPFPLAPDLAGEYGWSAGDQRHRAVVNGIWTLPRGLQLSGLYFYGSGARAQTTCGCGDTRRTGRGAGGRLRLDGTVIPLGGFVGQPLHRVDLRLQQRVPISGRMRVDGIFEVFNVFNYENYGTYTLAESNRNFGKPAQNVLLAYAPRMMQLGFRLAF